MFRLVVLLSILALAPWEAPAEPVQEAPQLVPVFTGLSSPVYLTHAGDGSGRLFIVEQSGRILVAHGATILPRPFLDIRNRVTAGGELGLLSVAFHPRFRQNGRLFVNYTARDGEYLRTIIAEYHVSADNPDLAGADESIILKIAQPFANHNGGQLQFGPDGFLYIGMGDGGGAGDPFGNGQNTETLLGAMLRIDVDGAQPYGIPPDNPFADGPGADEIWAYGLRNPWRFSFDPETKRLFAADVGQNKHEEVDLIVRGGNYGWNRMEGAHCYPPSVEQCAQTGFILPITEYGRNEGISVTGGYVYHGEKAPSLKGAYVFGDFGSAAIWALREQAPGQWKQDLLLHAAEPISSFGLDESGELYVIGYQGTIFRIERAPINR